MRPIQDIIALAMKTWTSPFKFGRSFPTFSACMTFASATFPHDAVMSLWVKQSVGLLARGSTRAVARTPAMQNAVVGRSNVLVRCCVFRWRSFFFPLSCFGVARADAKRFPQSNSNAAAAMMSTDSKGGKVQGVVIGIDLGTTNSCVAVMDGRTPKVCGGRFPCAPCHFG